MMYCHSGISFIIYTLIVVGIGIYIGKVIFKDKILK
jgi:hypothetical protein